MQTIHARNVNGALVTAMMQMRAMLANYPDDRQHVIAPRGMPTVEFPHPVATTYTNPMERVLFVPERDANPFFHLMESLWILAGRQDVGWLAMFNSRMGEFSDDGEVFHGAYGYRLRHAQHIDQFDEVVDLFGKDPHTRRAVLQIWDARADLNTNSKDIPCNDLVFLKLRDGALHMRVLCRSNDILWGAYGANVVQFSMLLEYLAGRIGAHVGTLTQVSDSFHAYLHPHPGGAVLQRCMGLERNPDIYDHYETGIVQPYPFMKHPEEFDDDLEVFFSPVEWANGNNYANPFFPEVAVPARAAYAYHKANNTKAALDVVRNRVKALDWQMAMAQWLNRRYLRQMEQDKD